MKVATIRFSDRDSGDEVVMVVRVAESSVGLALSLKKNGDVEVFLDAQALDQLINALTTAHRSLRADPQ